MDAPEPQPSPAKASPRRARAAIAAAAVVIVTLGVGLWAVTRPADASRVATAIPAPVPAPTPTPVVTPTPPPPPPPVPHDVVAAAAPTSFDIKGPAFEIKAHVCAMADAGTLDPPGEQHHTVCWVRNGFGVAPGTTSATSYILGHSWGQDSQEVLNDLSSTAMRQVLKGKTSTISGVTVHPITVLNGYVITLRTGTGVLKYTVKDAYAVNKDDAALVKPLMDQNTPKRVVLLTCGELKHVDYDYNIVVDAYLTSSRAIHTD